MFKNFTQTQGAHTQTAIGAIPLSMNAIMRKVYLWMTAALLVTALVAYQVMRSALFFSILRQFPFLPIVLLVAQIALVVVISRKTMTMRTSHATMTFIAYSALNGLTLSPIFLIYTNTSIAGVFFMTAGMFAAMSLFGMITKKDLSAWGQMAIMGIFGIIIASVVNIFFWPSGLLYYMISIVGVLIFAALTAYDTQKIYAMAQTLEAQTKGDEGVQTKIAILGALNLYLDFINLFIYLLRIFGNRN